MILFFGLDSKSKTPIMTYVKCGVGTFNSQARPKVMPKTAIPWVFSVFIIVYLTTISLTDFILPIPVAEAQVVLNKTLEAHLRIPQIGVDAPIKDMGLTSQGAMAVPSNSVDVGWFSLGTRPGDIGSAVIGAHVRWASAPGVFAHLNLLKKGDILSVVDATGGVVFFIVRDIRTFDATDTDSGIFDSKNGAHLNLITCSGAWIPSAKTYAKRLVIFTDAVL